MRITEVDTLTTWLGATPSGLISGPPPSSPHFMLDALPAATLPLYPGLGQAPNMLVYILTTISNSMTHRPTCTNMMAMAAVPALTTFIMSDHVSSCF